MARDRLAGYTRFGPKVSPDFEGWLTEATKRAPLLTAADEQLLARRIEAGRRAADLLAGDSPPPRSVPRLLRLARLERVPESRRVVDWLRAIETEGRRARGRFIESNLLLARHVARQRSYMAVNGIERDDLFAMAVRGLIAAVDRFDWRRGLKFSTYARHWVDQAMQRGFMGEARTIRLPSHIHQALRTAYLVGVELEQELGREPTDAEIVERMTARGQRVTVARLRRYREVNDRTSRTVSLDTPVGEDGEGTLGELLPGDDVPVDAQVAARDTHERLIRVLTTLPERQRVVLELRFGFTNAEPMTLEEIGRQLGLTKERIRQIEAQALGKLRHPSIARRLVAVPEGPRQPERLLDPQPVQLDTKRTPKPRVTDEQFVAWQRAQTGDGAA